MKCNSIFLIISLLFLFLGAWFLNIPYIANCLLAKQELKKHFYENKENFISFATTFDNTSPLQFEVYSGDTIFMNLQDTSINSIPTFIDSTYRINSNTKSLFQVNSNNCLEVIENDTIRICNHSWQVIFYGSYKDKRIHNLLSYYGWTSSDFEKIVVKVKELGCSSLSIESKNIKLNYKIISYYNDGGTHCFGPSDGYFDYLYTKEPDSFIFKENLIPYEGDYYGVEVW